ncbi:MAG: DUF3631 domain-containing protein [Actinomycetota bacterium]
MRSVSSGRPTDSLGGLTSPVDHPKPHRQGQRPRTSQLTPRTLARILREFGIRSGTYRFPSGKAKGYAANDFLDAWNRYLPQPDATDRDPPGEPHERRGIRGIRGAPGQRPGSATDGRTCHGNQPLPSPSTTARRDHRPTRPTDLPGESNE